MLKFNWKSFFLPACLIFTQLNILASQCPNVSSIAPNERGHWVSYGWYSPARAPSPEQFHLTFSHVALFGAREGGFVQAQCVYNDSYSNGMVILKPNTTQANYTPLMPINPTAWTFAANGQMATCTSDLPGHCTFR